MRHPVNKSPLSLPAFAFAAALVCSVVFAYWRVWSFGFVNFDDLEYVVYNPHIRDGLTGKGLLWALTTGYAGNWHPLTWISLMADIQFFGLSPGPMHLLNVLLHLSSALLLFGLLYAMTGYAWRSCFVAFLFALHPLHVESVAWISERKDVLSAFFFMLVLWSYARYAKTLRLRWYFCALGVFVLGLTAKPMLVTVPLLLLLLDYWPLERPRQPMDSGFSGFYAAWQPFLLEKVPFLLLSLISSVITYLVQQKGELVVSLTNFPLSARMANSLLSYMKYIGKMFWPTDLAVLYLHPLMAPHPPTRSWYIGAGLLLALLTYAACWLFRRHKFLAVGWLWYLITMMPVIGLVQVGIQAMADRYTYLPLIGLFIMLVWAVAELVARYTYVRRAAAVVGAIVVCMLMMATRRQVSYWQNSITLFRHAIEVTDDNYVMYTALGKSLETEGRLRDGFRYFVMALQIKPDYPEARAGYHRVLAKLKAQNGTGTVPR